jgi:hypothetical protein
MASQFKIHPYCDAFPDMSGDELKALALDIQNNGLQNPIWRYAGKIIDGKNRLKACDIADVKPDFREWNTKATDPLVIDKQLFDFVLSQNEKRRHMDQSQRAIAAAKLAVEYDKAHPKPPAPETNGEAGDGAPEADDAPTTLEMAANVMGVSPRSVDFAAKVVKSGAADLVEAVERGEVAVSDAAAVSVLDKSDQKEALAKVRDAAEKGETTNLRKAAGRKLKRPKPASNRNDRATAADFDDSEFNDLMGGMVKFLNARVKVFPEKSLHRAVISALDKVSKSWKEWRSKRK